MNDDFPLQLSYFFSLCFHFTRWKCSCDEVHKSVFIQQGVLGGRSLSRGVFKSFSVMELPNKTFSWQFTTCFPLKMPWSGLGWVYYNLSNFKCFCIKKYSWYRLLETFGLPEAGLPFPNALATVDVLVIVLLILGWSGLTWSCVIPEMFLKVSVLIADGLSLIPWVFPEASVFVWDTIGVIAAMLLLVSALVSAGFWPISGIRLQVVALVCDRFGSILGIVFPASDLVCGELPVEIFRKVSVFILGGCSRTSGIL